MPNPARQAIGIDVNAANNAAASAGTMNSTRVRESACESGAAMMPIAPANADATTVLTIESSFGDRPASMPYTSFSAAARVANPKRVQRYKAVERQRDQHHDRRHPEPVRRDRRAEDLDEVGGEDARDLLRP